MQDKDGLRRRQAFGICHPRANIQNVSQGKRRFEEMLCLHCAPTFAGIKPASLISFRKSEYPDFETLLASYAPCFQCSGIEAHRLADGEDYTLVLFYRREELSRALSQPLAKEILSYFGYLESDTLASQLSYLTSRMCLKKTFPHEIGLFLGYPPLDVKGFIEHEGKNFACVGYWKVYENAETAMATFEQMADCIELYISSLRKGVPFDALVTRGAA